MPALNNTRWELFALGMSRGLSQRDAYRQSGFGQDSSGNPSLLANKPEIQARIAELIQMREEAAGRGVGPSEEHVDAVAEAASTGVISKTWIIITLMEVARRANDSQQYSATIKALELLGREAGMFQPKTNDPVAELEAKRLDAERYRNLIPLDKLNDVLNSVLAASAPRALAAPTVPFPKKDPLREVRRSARMAAFPRAANGAILKKDLWAEDDREAIDEAVEAAVREHLALHPEDTPKD